ncbi:zinc finger protein with KRAB and SCAN domains 1-like [Embiotoca jacksoni]|uniref:zinc finger protein with KRAB and SCAN domains 1-like n=1 Tax=Embiotoca jacksoni TaxID=100190 RepID=UPI0037047044
MSRLQSLKVFICQRLTATVEEVIGHLETTLTEYEEEMESRHRRLLDAVSAPQDVLQRADIPQLVIKEEVSSEQQQQWSIGPDQGNPKHPHIKEEEEDIWSSVEEDGTRFTSTGEKRDEEAAGSAQRHPRQTEEDRAAESPACSSAPHIKTEEGGRGLEPARGVVFGVKRPSGFNDKASRSPEVETEDGSDDEIRKSPTQLNTTNTKVSPNHVEYNKIFSCFSCGKRFSQKHHLQTHMRCHTGEKPFSCSVCGKTFAQKGNMTQHQRIHTRTKPCSCPVCGEKFAQKGNLTQHMTVHKREKFCW